MDEMRITILDDGTIKTETNPISPANHASAEAFMNDIARLTGGATNRVRRGHTHSHGKTHTHVHQKS